MIPSCICTISAFFFCFFSPQRMKSDGIFFFSSITMRFTFVVFSEIVQQLHSCPNVSPDTNLNQYFGRYTCQTSPITIVTACWQAAISIPFKAPDEYGDKSHSSRPIVFFPICSTCFFPLLNETTFWFGVRPTSLDASVRTGVPGISRFHVYFALVPSILASQVEISIKMWVNLKQQHVDVTRGKEVTLNRGWTQTRSRGLKAFQMSIFAK